MPNPNWTPAAGARDANFSKHYLFLTTVGNIPPSMVDEIKFRLANFVDFNGGTNLVANVYINWLGGIRYAWFDMRGVFGVISQLVNGNPVPVRIRCDPAGTVYGDTADTHMLIGQRQWSVITISTNELVVMTQAYERPRNKRNELGMLWIGRSAQVAVWRAYLDNINTELTRVFGSFGMVYAPSVQTAPANPWRPANPYPHLSGCP